MRSCTQAKSVASANSSAVPQHSSQRFLDLVLRAGLLFLAMVFLVVFFLIEELFFATTFFALFFFAGARLMRTGWSSHGSGTGFRESSGRGSKSPVRGWLASSAFSLRIS